jgi:phosphohistidine phosphatase SixA
VRWTAILPTTVLGALCVLTACQSPSPPAATTAPTKPVASAALPAAVTSPAAGPTDVTMILSTPAPSPAAVPAASPTTASGAAPSPVACQIMAGFATLRDLIGATTVGSCLEDARQITANGNTEQRTTNGLFVLRALDSRVLFVGADQSWVNHEGAVETRRGGQIVYFRHGATDPNERDTDPDNLANCATQRNLTEAGRQQGRTIGEALRAMNVPVGQIFSSGYCRAREYARLIFNQDAEVEASMALPDLLSEQQRAQNTEAFKRLLARPPQPGVNTFMVAHSPNIRLAADVDLPEEGGAAIFRIEQGAPVLVARVRPEEWALWTRAMGSR